MRTRKQLLDIQLFLNNFETLLKIFKIVKMSSLYLKFFRSQFYNALLTVKQNLIIKQQFECLLYFFTFLLTTFFTFLLTTFFTNRFYSMVFNLKQLYKNLRSASNFQIFKFSNFCLNYNLSVKNLF